MDNARTGGRILTQHRSYDADEVDAFLRRVRLGVARLKKERQAAVDRAAEAERREDERAAALGRRVVRMQQALDHAMADARQEAHDLIAEARSRADRILAAAAAKAQGETGAVVVAAGPHGHPAPWTRRPPASEVSGDDFFTELGRSLTQVHDVGPGVTRSIVSPDEATSDARCRSCAGSRRDDHGPCTSCGTWPDEFPPDESSIARRFRRAVERPRAPVAAVGLGSLLPRRRS